MKRETATAVLAVVVGISGVAATVYADSNDHRDNQPNHRNDRADHREYRNALEDLKRARETLATTGGNWEGRRKEALTQTGYAIEQVYAGIGDDAAKARDQQEFDRLMHDGQARRNDDRDNPDQNRRDMQSALDRLSSARQELIRLPNDDSRRQKSIQFTEQAIKDVQNALANSDRSR